ncbi:uncharacterized protein LOC123556521 isoform X1 [Mercenaria mercenaria]|uniref:uncharacterized protein LOC123556521 isoform X1 n=1 Tax=Mercenaria mercenaria TaxID=6596 RepID=UPI00234EDE3B|nr:uncharacterized protein LOC123556521 isoform X1 [Mercenaria mercenaria]
MQGMREGFDTGLQYLPETSYQCRNLRSAISQPEIVSELLQKEITKGYLLGPFDFPPFETYRINPIGVVEGKYSKTFRLIVDLSAPHNNTEHSSINSLIDKEEYSLSYVSVDDAIKIIKQCGQGAMMCKTDIIDAFKLIPIKPELWAYHGICWNNKFYFFKRLCFGSRSSPKIFSMLSEAIHFIATNNYKIPNLLYLLDDFLAIVPKTLDSHRYMALLTHVFGSLSVPIHPDKTLGPSTTMSYLGITLDSVKMQAYLPLEKVQRIKMLLDAISKCKSITKRKLLSVLGHLNFASRVIRPGRSFVSYLLKLAASVRELHYHVKLSQECLSDMRMWYDLLNNWNGISFFYDDHVTECTDIELYTDASGSCGYGGYYQGRWFAEPWPEELPKLGETDMSIAFMELVPIVTSVVLWQGMWSKKQIRFHCDNQATVDIINKGRSKSSLIMKLMRRLTWCAVKGNFIVHARYFPGKFNVVSDSLSRFQMQRFRRLAPDADKYPTKVPPLCKLYLG